MVLLGGVSGCGSLPLVLTAVDVLDDAIGRLGTFLESHRQ